MKNLKKIIVLSVLLIAAGNVFGASSGMGNLSKTLKSFDNTKKETAVCELPAGKELLPALWHLTHTEIKVDGKILLSSYSLDMMNPIEEKYKITSRTFYKFGMGVQCQEAVYSIVVEEGKVKVETKNLCTYNVDKEFNRTGDRIEASVKAMNEIGKLFINDVEGCFKVSEDEYNLMCERAYSSIAVQDAAGKHAPNRLKAKKWYDRHSLNGKKVLVNAVFADITESRREGYEYEVRLLYGLSIIELYTNDDSFLDMKEGKRCDITGLVTDVIYSSELSTDYKIERIVIEGE